MCWCVNYSPIRAYSVWESFPPGNVRNCRDDLLYIFEYHYVKKRALKSSHLMY